MYVKGEVVWAKIKGFPWWPGVVAKVVEDKTNPHGNMEVLVNFIGENSHAQLSLDKVAKYQQKYNEFAKMKKKKLLESIEIADKILRGETTFEFESEKLKEEYRNLQNDIKPKPKPSDLPSLKKAKSDRPSDKSPNNGGDSSLHNYESDQSSTQDAELGSSPGESIETSGLKSNLTENKKKGKETEKKEVKRKNSLPKTGTPMVIEKGPIAQKNPKAVVNGKREAENKEIELEEAKPAKNLKPNENMEESKKTEKTEDNLNKPVRQNSRQSTASAPSAITTNKSSASTENSVTVQPVLSSTNSQTENTTKTNKKANIKGFEDLFNLLIEIISNNGSAPISASLIEKSIEEVLSKINPETVSISEILENNLGKNIHILIVLLDELCNSVPFPSLNIDSELSSVKDKLFSFIDIIKNRLTLHYIENVDYSSHWLKKLEEKRGDGAKRERKEPAKVVAKIQPSEEEGNNTSLRMEEELESDKNGLGPSLQISNDLDDDFEEFRFDTDKKKVLADKNPKMVTTTTSTTKIIKPIYNPNGDKKMDNKQKENVVNPNLRKKICLKMSKILQEKYRFEKDTAQELTLRIEYRIRQHSPDMQAEYKEKVLIILKMLKYSLLNVEDFANDFNVDFQSLKDRLDEFQSQHADMNLDGGLGDDSPPMAKDISRNSSMMNGNMGEVK